jgi:hypothetical protein
MKLLGILLVLSRPLGVGWPGARLGRTRLELIAAG